MDAGTKARVQRGAALLDERRPDWWREIDVGRLSMSACNECVLGQLFGEEPGVMQLERPYDTAYDVGLAALGLGDRGCREAEAYGFDAGWFLHGVSLFDRYLDLREAWVAEIKHRWETLA